MRAVMACQRSHGAWFVYGLVGILGIGRPGPIGVRGLGDREGLYFLPSV
jgi:hypothetical protein